MMDLKEKASALTESAKNRWTEDRNDKMSRDIERLKVQNEALRDELERDRGRLSELLDTLGDSTHPKVKKHRMRRLIMLTSAAGAAYVMGAKAGRQRYDQLRSWFDDMRGKGEQMWESDTVQTGVANVQEGIANTKDAISEKKDEATKGLGTPPADEMRS
jgi:septal ring factor EnvC (AmiA/AmiB activator)